MWTTLAPSGCCTCPNTCYSVAAEKTPTQRSVRSPVAAIPCGTLYRHYAANRGTLAHVDRDARGLPALAEVMEPIWAYLDAVADRLGEGNASRRALPRVALELGTWQRLDAEGLSPVRATALMACAGACAGRGTATAPYHEAVTATRGRSEHRAVDDDAG